MASNDNSNKQIEPFKVYVRIRPFLPKELTQTTRKNSSVTLIDSKQNSQQKSVFIIEDNLLFLLDPTINNRKEKEYVFDGIFDEEHTNHSVFEKSIVSILIRAGVPVFKRKVLIPASRNDSDNVLTVL